MTEHATIAHVPLDQIQPPPHQLRSEIDPAALADLADSLAAHGQLQPIGLQPQRGDPCYVIIYGHRRYLAAQALGWTTIAAIIHPPHADRLNLALAENMQRSDLTPIEEARALAMLVARGLPTHTIAGMVRRSPAWCDSRLRLLKLPDDIQDAIHRHQLPVSIAHALARIDHESYRAYLVRDALAHGASLRTVESWVQHFLTERETITRNSDMVDEIAARRDQYVVLAPCGWCADPVPFETLHTWRLCTACHSQLVQHRQLAASAAAPDAPEPSTPPVPVVT